MDINLNIAHSMHELLPPKEILQDYRIAYRSRQMSLIGRKEVLSGRAKFGIFGDGKEVPQIALAHCFQHGDWRSGYYRDQTLMLALDEITVRSFFAQLYAHANLDAEPASGGRMMNAHFASRSLAPRGRWKDQLAQFNSSPDVSATAGQMARLVGLAYASRLYRSLPELKPSSQKFSQNGEEIAFGTIGNASTAEGIFWEAVNAIGVLGAPAVLSIWDDEYGISVPNKYQMLGGDIGQLLQGFQRRSNTPGFDVYSVDGRDYVALLQAYTDAAQNARQHHIPAVVHVHSLTQQQGHSTSGSHERYKPPQRLQYEKDNDCLLHMRNWMLAEEITTENVLQALEQEEAAYVEEEIGHAWEAYTSEIAEDRTAALDTIRRIAQTSEHADELQNVIDDCESGTLPSRRDILEAVAHTLRITRQENIPDRTELIAWHDTHKPSFQALYSTQLTSDLAPSPHIPPSYPDTLEHVPGHQVLNQYFDALLAENPKVIAFGEDIGVLGGVNQAFAGLQQKYGELRVSDTGIRETTIIGQATGMALRGLRPIAEIQYIDYIFYAMTALTDDLATLRWRTNGGQTAPVIIRTRGHRLEGIWHSGSPMGTLLHALRGVHICVPRSMTQAVGFYNTLLDGEDPGIIIEVLNAYRLKEPLPNNLLDMRIPLGTPEVLRSGEDITLVTYGAMCPIALEAAQQLAEVGVDVEVIDVQTLLPFDTKGKILESLKKTNKILFADEDVPGGATAYMAQQVLEQQDGFYWLDVQPRTLTSQAHRPAYGKDGNYFSKPNVQDVFDMVYDIMNSHDPARYPFFDRKENS